MANATLTDDRVALRGRVSAGGVGAAWRDKACRARQVCRSGRIGRRAGRLAATDERGHRTKHRDLTDGPERIHIRPRCRPLTDEDVSEAALNAGRGVPRCHRNCLCGFTLERCVLLDLEPRCQTAAQTFPAADAEVRRWSLHVDL